MGIDSNFLLHPHILYLVLLELPQVDLLLAQRVCKAWHTTIRASSALQKALFLQPDYSTDQFDKIELNSLLLHHFKGFFLEVPPRDRARGIFKETRWHEQASREHPDPKVLSAYARADASWRKMSPYRPAPRRLHVVKHAAGMMGHDCIYGSISFLAGEQTGASPLTTANFGLIYDVMQSHVFPSHVERGGNRAKVEIVGPANSPQACCDADGSCVRTTLPPDSARLRDYKRVLSTPDFAAPGSVIVRLSTTFQCTVHLGPMDYSEDYLRSKGAVVDLLNDVEWEEKERFILPYDDDE